MITTTKKPLIKLRPGVVAVISTTEGFLEIFEFEHSGKVITRKKIDTVTGVPHPGLIIGIDKKGRWWIAHNHYKNKKPTFDLFSKYADGETVHWDETPVDFTREEIVQRAISEVIKGRTYNYIDYNCQIFINLIVRDEQKSESVDDLSDTAMILGGLIGLYGIFTKNKGAIALGSTILGVGGIAKVSSKKRS